MRNISAVAEKKRKNTYPNFPLNKKKVSVSIISALLLFLAVGWLAKKLTQKPALETKFVQEIERPGSPQEASYKQTTSLELAQPRDKGLLASPRVSYQTFNNCGPATLSMMFSYYEIIKSQKELADLMRPYQDPKGDNDDKTIFPEEFVSWAEEFGLKSLHRPNGTIKLLKLFLANEIPVVVKQWLRPGEDIGHFRIVRGFDEKAKLIITDDSYFGPKRKHSYFNFLSMWQPFNYSYTVVFPEEKMETVLAILGEDLDKKAAYRQALERAKEESELDPESIYPIFNQATSYYHLEEHGRAIEAFASVEKRLPRRMLWYQIEPILAYQKLGEISRVFEISDYLFANGNRAFSELYQIRGEIYLEQGNQASARQEFELALHYNRNFEPANKALKKLDL